MQNPLFLKSIIAVQNPIVPLLVFLKRAPRVWETSVTLLSSLCRNGLNVLLNGRDYLWQRFSQCQFVHRGKYSSKGMFFSGCQTQLPLAVTSITCVTLAFSGPLQHGEKLLSSITSPPTLAHSLPSSLNSFPNKKVETFHCLFLTRMFFSITVMRSSGSTKQSLLSLDTGQW